MKLSKSIDFLLENAGPVIQYRLRKDNISYRRLLTEIAMLGVGESVGMIKESIAGIDDAIGEDGILKMI